MYTINKYQFNDFKCQASLHKANYAVLVNMPDYGIKYAPYSDFSEEYYLLQELSHPQIPAAYDLGQGDLFKGDKLLIKQNFVVLQHFNGYDLVDYFNKKNIEQPGTIDEIIKLFATICAPLQYLHNKNYIHCDLKPGHLIIIRETGLVSLVDFELAIKFGDIIKGISREYASPEQLQMLAYLKDRPRKAQHKDISATIRLDGKTDLYSVGLLLYQVLTKKIWQTEKIPPSQINRFVSHELEEVVLSLLETNVADRISSADELKKALSSI